MPGRRRGAQLRRQRQAAPRRGFSRILDPARRRRRRRRAGRGVVRPSPVPGKPRAAPAVPTPCKARSWARGLPTRKSERFLDEHQCSRIISCQTNGIAPAHRRGDGSAGKVVGWFQGGWNSDRAPWVAAAFSATPATSGCRASDEPAASSSASRSGPLPPACCGKTWTVTSNWTASQPLHALGGRGAPGPALPAHRGAAAPSCATRTCANASM